mgnify:CR=1 FL=1
MTPRLLSAEEHNTTLMRDDYSQEGSCTKPRDNENIKDILDQTYEERWSEAAIQSIVRRWHLSAAEEGQLRELKMRLADIDHWKNNPMDVVRYLRGPKKFEQIEGIFRTMIQWRQENKADQILEEHVPDKTLLYFFPSAILKGYDKDGDPIYLERGGAMDPVGLQKIGMETIMKHIIWRREQATRGDWLRDYQRKQGRQPAQVTIIFDMQGLSTRHLKSGAIPIFKEIVKINQERYCGMAKRIILLRAPAIFQMIWSIAKHFFPPEGRKLMVFTGPNDYLTALDKYVDREVLPPCICKEGRGSAVDCMPQNFNGGTIPSDPEKSIPNEPWIVRMLNAVGNSKKMATAKAKPGNAMKQQPKEPVCLADYQNVRIMAGPAEPQWHDEYEAVLVAS